MTGPKIIAGFVLVTALFLSFEARAEIYRCKGDDGNPIFQQMPCAQKKPAEHEAEETTTNGAGDEKDAPVESTEAITVSNGKGAVPLPEDPNPPEVVQLCKKKYRDAIDEIDAEMRQRYSSEQGEAYRQRLRVLTEQLRAC